MSISASLNVVTLVGRTGRDPELTYFETGKVKCTLTLAASRLRRKGEDTPPDWFDLEVWDKTAEICGEYVRKGDLLGVTGRLYFSRWIDKETQAPRERAVIKVDRMDMLKSKRDRNDGRYGATGDDADFVS